MATLQAGPEAPAPLLSGQGEIITPDTAAPSKKGKWQRFVTKIWDSHGFRYRMEELILSDYYDKSDAERRLVFKLDCFMLTSLTLGWWVKNLDQSNLAQAYVSGLREDLGIQGNEYTYMLTIYAAVVAAMQIPSNFIVMKVRPSRFIACCELCWGVFTFAQAGAKTVPHMYAFRFCVAFFESFFYPVAFFLVGSWYTRAELAKRTTIWFIAGPAGNAFSGFMQAGIHASLDGRLGLAGWRWLYIICGIVTLPIGLVTFFFVPDFPENTKVWYLSDAEKQMARDRCAQAGIARVTGKINWKLIGKTLKTWQFWMLVPWYTLYALGLIAGKQFPVYLRAFGYSVTMRNILPAVANLITIPTLLFYAWLADRIPNGRFWVILVVSLTSFWPITVLAFWFDSNAHRVASFLAVYAHYTTPIFFAWVAEICSQSAEMRGFITGCITCFWYATDAWIGPVIWLQTESPRFYKGFMTVFCASVISTVALPLIQYLYKREAKLRRVDSDTGSLNNQEEDAEKK